MNYEEGWIWIKKNEEGEIISPYKLLPPIFNEVEKELSANFLTNEILSGGGDALTAFAKMQFTEMTELERTNIIKGLLKYCELDTLAMVMIYEFWLNEIADI